MATALHVPVEQVTLDAALVAQTVADIWEVCERIIAFNGDATRQSEALDRIGENLYRAAFTIENDEKGGIIGLWSEISDLAKQQAVADYAAERGQ